MSDVSERFRKLQPFRAQIRKYTRAHTLRNVRRSGGLNCCQYWMLDITVLHMRASVMTQPLNRVLWPHGSEGLSRY